MTIALAPGLGREGGGSALSKILSWARAVLSLSLTAEFL